MSRLPSLGEYADGTAPVAGDPAVTTYQPYFLAYARSQGSTPEAIIITHPRSWQKEYLMWIRSQWREYRKHIGVGHNDVVSPEQRDAFQVWIDGRVA